MDALAEGDEGVQAIRARLREETIKRDRLTAEIERLEQVPVPDVGKLLAAVEERARDLRRACPPPAAGAAGDPLASGR